MKSKRLSQFLATYLLFCGGIAHSEIVGIETFDYADGELSGQSGGTSWNFSNSGGNSGTASTWATIGGASPQVLNGKLVTDSGEVRRPYNGPVLNERDGAFNDSSVNRQVYYRVEVTTTDHLAQNVGMSSLLFETARLFFGVPLSAGAQKFGIEEAGGSRTESTMIANSPQTYTLVTKLDFDSDLVSLWVNPDLSQPEGIIQPTVTQSYSGTDSSSAISLSSVGEATWDNLIVATDWSDLGVIDPGAGQPLAAETRVGAGGETDHDDYFFDYGRNIRLNNGNVVVSYNSRDNAEATPPSPDGDGYGGYFRIYTSDGSSPSTEPIAPYLDINPGGIGEQRAPLTAPLVGGGFAIVWNSAGGPGDVGGGSGFSAKGDTYTRVYSASGIAVSGSVKVNENEPTGIDDDQRPVNVVALTGGGYAVVYRDDNDNSGNTDDYFVRMFSAAGVAIGPSVQLGSEVVHGPLFQDFDDIVALSDGGFACCWTSRGDDEATADGDNYGVFFQTFHADGSAESAVTFPYIDINFGGVGVQNLSYLTALANGFAMSWTSFAGPGDIGGRTFSGGDTYLRVFDNAGIATNSTSKVNDLTTEWNDIPVAMTTLTDGNFVIAWKDGEDEKPVDISGPNKDDFFVRTYSAAGVALGASVQLGDAVHEALFQDFGNLIPLADGGFATCWRTRDSANDGSGTSADGDGYGAFLQAFNADGTDRSGLIIPYLDINPNGTGSQNSPILTPLAAGGFAATWNSARGPGDVGVGGNNTSGGDTYTRLFANSGLPNGDTQQAHVGEPTGVDDTQSPRGIVEANGSYLVIFGDDNRATDNKDDLFVRIFTTIAPASSGKGPILVTNTANDGPGSLRDAIDRAPDEKGTISFDPSLSGKIIQLTGDALTIDAKTDLAIDGSNLSEGIIVDGFGNSRVFAIGSGASVAIHSLGITGGNADNGAGIDVRGASLDLTHSTIWGNTASVRGGGLFCNTNLSGSETVALRRCTIANNSAEATGGGINNQRGLTTLISCTVSNNTAPAGGGAGIANFGSSPARTELSATIVRENNGSDVDLFIGTTNSFQSNGSNIVGTGEAIGNFVEDGDMTGNGTAINLTALSDFGGPTLTMHPRRGSAAVNPTTSFPARSDQRGFGISGNADIGAVELGGFVSTVANGGLGSLLQTVSDCPPDGHITFDPELSGRTIFVTAGELLVGKKLHIDASPLADGVTISGSNFSRVFNVFNAGDLTLEKLTVADGDSGVQNGGGILVTNPGRLTVIDCTIRDCTAPCAGAITTDGSVTLIRSTLSGNSAGSGGAICMGGSARVTLSHSTISGNEASNFGGGIAFFDGELVLEQSIVAGNSAPIGDNITDIPSTQLGNNLIIGDPQLTPLDDFGGPTHTMLPLPGSRAIDMAIGSTSPLDQRGRARNGIPDIGAAELSDGRDLAVVWETDYDNDGSPFGVEHALGTDPFLADPENLANLQLRFNALGEAVIEFGYNTEAIAETVWILERSFTLDDDWEEVYFSEDPDFGENTSFGVLTNAGTSVELTDTTATDLDKKVFYRFKASLSGL